MLEIPQHLGAAMLQGGTKSTIFKAPQDAELLYYFVMGSQFKSKKTSALCRSSCYNIIRSGRPGHVAVPIHSRALFFDASVTGSLWTAVGAEPQDDPKHLWRETSSRPSRGIDRADPNEPELGKILGWQVRQVRC